jgi:hypothetical protein
LKRTEQDLAQRLYEEMPLRITQRKAQGTGAGGPCRFLKISAKQQGQQIRECVAVPFSDGRKGIQVLNEPLDKVLQTSAS